MSCSLWDFRLRVPSVFSRVTADARRFAALRAAHGVAALWRPLGGLVALVRDRIGPVASFREAVVVQRLPKTRSGKILRGTMRAIADGREYAVPSTIDDPVILDEIAASLAGRR